MSPKEAMVFAAGFGTRMGALTKMQPKPMIKVANKPLIDHTIDMLRAGGVHRSVVNTHYLAEHLSSHFDGVSDVVCVNEAPQVLETGGGLKNALHQFEKNTVFTINSDIIWSGESPIKTLESAWDPVLMQALLILVPKAKAVAHSGVGDFFLLDDGRIQRRNSEASAPFVFGGAQIITTNLVREMPDSVFSLNVIWDQMLAAGTAFGVVFDGDWCDVGNAAGIEAAEVQLERRQNV